MKTKRDSSNPSSVPATTSSDSSSTKPSVQPVQPTGSTPAVEVEVKIADLKFDPELQMRAQPHDLAYIMELVGVIKAGTLTEPIVVFRDPADGNLWVADGHARADAVMSAGGATIRARVYRGGLREAFEFALGANATHGVRRSNADLRHAVLTALKDPRTARYTSKKIAELCHCSDHYVGGLRKELSAANGDAPEVRVTGEDGKSYPARRPRKAAVPSGSTLATTPTVAGASPPSTNHTAASTNRGARAGIAVTEGAPTAASHDGRSVDVTTQTGPEHDLHEVVGVTAVEPPQNFSGDSSHVVSARGEGVPSTVPTDASAASPSEGIPSASVPTDAMRDPIAQLHELLPVIREALAAHPELLVLTVPAGVIGDLRGDVERFIACLHDRCRPVDVERSVPATASDLFHGRMGYNPNPSRPWDVALLGVFEEDLAQERMSA